MYSPQQAQLLLIIICSYVGRRKSMSERKENKEPPVGIVMAMPSISPHVPSVQAAMVVLFL